MRIKKYLHSCIVLEEKGKRLLIDPGVFSFIENKIKPEDIGPVDVILLTHKHLDHYFPEALKKILALKSAKILAHKEIAGLLEKESIGSEIIEAGETKEVSGFEIQALRAPHEAIPTELPENLAFFVNGRFLHPGDSFSVIGLDQCEILALPIVAPWATLVHALEFGKKLRPEYVIPIHDAILKDFMLERTYAMCEAQLKAVGTKFSPLKLEEAVEI